MEAVVASSPSLPPGTRFGDFLAMRPLAAGGMAELYLAARPRADDEPELVAIKRLLPHLGWDPEFVRMFLDEVRIAASLDHPNIVRVIDFGVGEGGHYLAMEYLHGRTLRSILRSVGSSGPLPLGFAVGTVMEIAAGLHAAHEHQDADGKRVEVVHRDVSPSNVMVTFGGRVKLLDFGIARVSEQTQLTRAGTLKGKVGYMSPEQCRGDRVDRRSDVFGLGILLFELTVGRRAFYADNDYAVIGKIADGNFTRPRELVAEYPAALEAVLMRTLEVDPADRYPTAAALAEELARVVAAEELDVGASARAAVLEQRFEFEPVPRIDLATLLAPPTSEPRRSPWFRWAMLGLGLGLGLMLGGFVLGGWIRSGAPSPGTAAVQAVDERGTRGREESPAPVAGQSAVDSDPVESAGEGPSANETGTTGREPTGTGTTGEGPSEVAAVQTEPEKTKRTKRRRSRRRRRPKSRPKSGDPNTLLPPTWRK